MTAERGIMIVENKYGYAPSRRIVRDLLRRAKKAGLFSDWSCVMTLEDGDLLFGRLEGKDDYTSIIASKRNRKWQFFTDTYLELNA